MKKFDGGIVQLKCMFWRVGWRRRDIPLEAGLEGCNLVITDRGDTREYFGDMAYYCDPGSEASIREAVLKAYSAPVCTALQHRIRTEFNWTKTAEATIKGYRQIYNGNDYGRSYRDVIYW